MVVGGGGGLLNYATKLAAAAVAWPACKGLTRFSNCIVLTG